MISKNVFPAAIAFFSKLKKLAVFPTTDFGEREGLVLWRTVQWVGWVEIIRGCPLAIWAGDQWRLSGATSPLGPIVSVQDRQAAATFAWEVMALDVLVQTSNRLGSP